MRYLLAVLGLLAACDARARSDLNDAPRALPDAAYDAPPDDVPLDAPVCSTFIASTSTATDVLAYTLTGGAFASYGCAPIDPNYWMSGSGMSVTVTFVAPQSYPSLRVWGMNTDDTAELTVNGTAYTLDAASASLSPKVVCGISPGPDGVAFVGGLLAGANTPGQGNYSHQDITINQVSVTSIQISGLTGAGWGFAGTSVADACTEPR